MPSENKETGKTRFSARVQRNSGFVRFDNAAHWHLNFFVRNGKIFLQSPGLEHIRVLARRGGGIGRHAVLRWQWLRRASSTLALDTMTIRGCILRDAAFFVSFRKGRFVRETARKTSGTP